ncbi:MAG: hypothetical protein JO048_12950 [Methylobacteriaceae bacterium]|nr:hypothetical protein [Methylobacteriaceae bacterium]
MVDSVTALGPEAQGAVALAASHGGVYAAYLAAKAGVRAVVLSDAGIGRERAGVAGLPYLERLNIAAVCLSHRSCRIGDGADAASRGVVSVANGLARALGIGPDQPARDALERLAAAPATEIGEVAPEREARSILDLPGAGPHVAILDSASLVRPEDAGAIVVTGSHGGLLGGRPETGLRADTFAALFNDADRGRDDAGVTRLPALDARGIAAGTVSAWSARIGDGASTYADGVISAVNARAAGLGVEIGMSARAFVAAMRVAAAEGR